MLEGYLPEYILSNVNMFESIQEIRIRLGKQYAIISQKKEYLYDIIDNFTFGQVMKMITSHSVYAIRENLRNGFITIKGGHRVGFCGTCVIRNGEIYHIKDITGINIRIAREYKGICEKIYGLFEKRFDNLLIISPPGCGKTTFLRDMARILSSNGSNVSVVDERGEIFPYDSSGSIFDNGKRCDVITSCSKSDGIRIMLRVMNPDVIVCDEISTVDDAYSIQSASGSGVKIIASMHGFSFEDYSKRPEFKELVNNNVFNNFIILSKKHGVGTIEDVIQL